MLTKKTLVLSVLFAACVGCQGRAAPENIDAMWSDMSSEERVAHLEAELDDARDAMRGAANLEEWDVLRPRFLRLLGEGIQAAALEFSSRRRVAAGVS